MHTNEIFKSTVKKEMSASAPLYFRRVRRVSRERRFWRLWRLFPTEKSKLRGRRGGRRTSHTVALLMFGVCRCVVLVRTGLGYMVMMLGGVVTGEMGGKGHAHVCGKWKVWCVLVTGRAGRASGGLQHKRTETSANMKQKSRLYAMSTAAVISFTAFCNNSIRR